MSLIYQKEKKLYRFRKKLLLSIKNAKNIALFSHNNSDHDSICSSVALYLILKKMGKTAHIFVEKTPNDSILKFVPKGVKLETETKGKFDLALVTDTANYKLLPENCRPIFDGISQSFCMDHHADNTKYCKHNLVLSYSSACEVLFWLFYGYIEFDEQIATLLYTGMFMDCGSFVYDSASSKTFRAASILKKYAPNANSNFFNCFGVMGYLNFEITKIAFNSVKFYEDGKIAVSYLRNEDYKKANCTREDGKFIVSYLQNVKGVKIAISVSENEQKPKFYNISLRTACDDVNVSKIAHRFNGGGHVRASGLTLQGDVNKAINALILECKKELNK